MSPAKRPAMQTGRYTLYTSPKRLKDKLTRRQIAEYRRVGKYAERAIREMSSDSLTPEEVKQRTLELISSNSCPYIIDLLFQGLTLDKIYKQYRSVANLNVITLSARVDNVREDRGYGRLTTLGAPRMIARSGNGFSRSKPKNTWAPVE